MKRNALWTVLTVILIVGLSDCSSGSATPPPPPPVISVSISQAPPTTMLANTTASVAATVTNDSAGVNWSCTPTGSCGSFSPTQTGSGVTTTYTAPDSVQSVTITATSVTDSSKNANAPVSVTVNNFTFYLSGLETGENFYGIAGTITMDGTGNILGGETDYNDADGITSQPGGDTISGGVVTVDSTSGQGTITLITSNPAVGVAGTETLGVQFVNSNHALIVQFDGSATSSGSMDFQTTPAPLSGSFSFALSGVNSGFVTGRRAVTNSVVSGGVFATDGANITNGQIDLDDGGTIEMHGTAFTGTMTGPDLLGRGTITDSYTDDMFVYYVVGPEAIRIIDVDAGDSAVGSAYGQGTSSGGFSINSVGQSVFYLQSNPLGFNYAAAGMFVPYYGASTLSGVADVNEEGLAVEASPIVTADFAVGPDGYGQITFTNGGVEDVTHLGMYMTDPNLNLLDPNNTSTGLGGALLVELDSVMNGTGMVLPQTDIVAADFSGSYAFGAQVFDGGGVPNVGWETDFVGNGTVTAAGSLTGTALDSDPFFTLTSTGENTGVGITGTLVADGVNPGRYTMADFTVTVGSPTFTVPVAIYQASAEQLVWIDDWTFSLFGGTLQQEPQASSDAVKKAKAAAKKKTAR